MNLAKGSRLPPELECFRVATANNVFIELCDALAIQDCFDDEVDHMPGASETVFRSDGADLFAHGRNKSIVIWTRYPL